MDILDAYNRLVDGTKHRQLPKLHRGGCSVEPMHYADSDEVWSALVSSSPRQGWLQFQSKQLAFDRELPVWKADWGMLLAAEATTVQGGSIALGLNGSGGWIVTHYRPLPDGNLLYDEPLQLAHDPELGALRYRRWWRCDPDQGFIQVFACFIGFDKGETE